MNKGIKMKSMAAWYMNLLVLMAMLLSGCDLDLTIQRKGQISIKSDPDRAKVLINGKVQGQTPCVIRGLMGGDYLIELRKEGYNKLYKSVSLLDGQQLELELKMKPVNGLLLVESNPPGADVFIDGISKGRTPLLIYDLPVGSYKFEFKSETQLPRTVSVDVTDRLPKRVYAELISNTARLTVHSTPEGAEVRINGVKMGETPLTIEEIKAGQTEIKVYKRGYKPYLASMSLEATKSYEIGPELEALPAGLTVISVPEGAKITIDKKPVGIAPLTLTDLSDGMHEVVAEMPGYETKTKTIFLEPDINDSVEFIMKKNSGTLVLDTEPANVQVYVDGKFITTTMPKDGSDTISQPVRITLKADCDHTLQLVREGFIPNETTVRVGIDKMVTLHEVLKRIFVRDIKVVTKKNNVYKARLEYRLPNGDLYLEFYPGVFDTIKADDIREATPITLDDEINREARRLIEQSRNTIPKQ